MIEPIFFVGGWPELHPQRMTGVQPIRTAEEMKQAFATHRRGALWIAADADALAMLASLVGGEGGDQRLLVLPPVRWERLVHLRALFRSVVAADEAALLPLEELLDVLASPHREDFLIGGSVSLEDRSIVLHRGSLEPLVVPMSWFRVGGTGCEPNFLDFEIIDGGQTVRLGEYEAAADAIFYELDREYRRRAKKRLREEDDSLGGAIQRLRLQRGLTRSGFGELSAKEIARIERGEVAKPRPKTLALIADRLGVTVEDLGSY